MPVTGLRWILRRRVDHSSLRRPGPSKLFKASRSGSSISIIHMTLTYFILFIVLFAAEVLYFKIADHYKIVDKPNVRSSHTKNVRRGGGVIFPLSIIAWGVMLLLQGEGQAVLGYWPFFVGLLMLAVVSFWDDIHSLSDMVRLVVQLVAILLMFGCLGILRWELWWFVPIALIVYGGALNIINFMDGINGITVGYALVVLVTLALLNAHLAFIEASYLFVAMLGALVFGFFNFRPKGKARCFAGDVGSIGMAFILLFPLGKLIVQTWDVTYLILLIMYGVDGYLTIVHRIMLREPLGQAHRKHAYQIMVNELKMSHVTVSCIYMVVQLAISLGFIYLCPDTLLAHWIYLIVAGVVLSLAYVLFMKKYYHLHEEYLKSLEK